MLPLKLNISVLAFTMFYLNLGVRSFSADGADRGAEGRRRTDNVISVGRTSAVIKSRSGLSLGELDLSGHASQQ